VPIELRDALELGELDTRFITEYNRRNQVMVEYTQGLKKFEVPEKLTLDEAVGLFEIWKGMKVFGSGRLKALIFSGKFSFFKL
jgi:small subunit ribosomal protein S29